MNRWLFFMLLLAAPLCAAPSPWVTENSNSLSWKAVEDDNGGFYLLWTHQDADHPRLMGQHISAQGAPLWPEPGQTFLPVLQDTAAWTMFPDSHEGLALAWVQNGKIMVQRWTPDGQPAWKTPAQVSDTRFVSATPTGVADGGGGFYVVWTEKMYADRAVLMAQHLTANAVPLWPLAIRVSLRQSNQQQPAVAFDGAAGLVITWADSRDFASAWRVQRINYQGFRLWGLEGIEMAAPAGSGSSALRMAPWGQGSLTVAWVDSVNGRNKVKSRQINPQGTLLPDTKIPPLTTGDQWNPVLTGDGQGRYWVGWEDNRNEKNWKVYLRHGEEDLPLSLSWSGDQGRLALAQDNAQGVFAAWIENRKSGTGLYAQHLSAEGQEMWQTGGREVTGVAKHAETPTILLLMTDHAAIVWSDHPAKGRQALYWQLL